MGSHWAMACRQEAANCWASWGAEQVCCRAQLSGLHCTAGVGQAIVCAGGKMSNGIVRGDWSGNFGELSLGQG